MARRVIDDFRRGRLAPLLTLMAANVAVWLVVALTSLIAGARGGDSSALFSLLALSPQAEVLLRHPWTPLTYMWVHASFIHMAVNMIWLFWFWELLSLFPAKRLMTLYIGGGLCGAIFFLAAALIWSARQTELCGSSACVLALMGATAVAFPKKRVRFLFSDNVRLIWIVAAAILLVMLASAGPLSLAAHLGGLAAGTLGMAIIKYSDSKRVIVKKTPSRRQVRSFAKKAAKAMAEAPRPEAKAPATSAEDAADVDEARLQLRLDELLDKIRLSGYESLSAAERGELQSISLRLGR